MAEPKGVGGPPGPRVLGRLTQELILRSPQYMNCVKQYEIDLRANRITTIENLGGTEVRRGGGRLGGMGGGGGRGGGRALTQPPLLPPALLVRVRPPQNQFDSIDLSDNAIVRLEGFPKLPRLKVLHLNNNRVARVGRHLEGAR